MSGVSADRAAEEAGKARVADLSPGFPGDVAMETLQKGWFKYVQILEHICVIFSSYFIEFSKWWILKLVVDLGC